MSWADTNPDYGELPLSQPIRIESGCTAGFVIHTNDLYGLVMAVGAGAGGDVVSQKVFGNICLCC